MQAARCRGFSCCRSRGLGRVGFRSCGSRALEYSLSNCGTWAQLLHSMWDLPRPGIEPVSPAPAGGFFTTEPPGKPHPLLLKEGCVWPPTPTPHPFQLPSPWASALKEPNPIADPTSSFERFNLKHKQGGTRDSALVLEQDFDRDRRGGVDLEYLSPPG